VAIEKGLSPKDKKLAWIVVLVLVGILLLLSLLKGSGNFSVSITGGPTGDFVARVENNGSKAGTPTCTVEAFDGFGNQIGSEQFKLDVIPAYSSDRFSGKVGVNEVVSSYKGDC
jgi:hypothetical protein